MHMLTALISVIAVYRWGDWRNWEKYHSTLLFFALGNLTYNFLTANYFLWRLDADFLSNHTLTEMLYTFIVFPATGILFLGNYPLGLKNQILHNLYYIFVYGIWEFIFLLTGHVEYQYGWTIWWSIAFLFIMFPFLKLHEKRPLLTYLLSACVAVLVVWWFEIPVHIPVEHRTLYD